MHLGVDRHAWLLFTVSLLGAACGGVGHADYRGAPPPRPAPGETQITKWQDAKTAAVSLTFDDGSANQFRVALPLMRRLGLPATFFIITGEISGSGHKGTFVGRPLQQIILDTATTATAEKNFFERATAIRFSGYKGARDIHTQAGELYESGKVHQAYALLDEAFFKIRMGDTPREPPQPSVGREQADRSLSWGDLKQFASQGFEFASHTVTHPMLSVLDEANLVYELEKSRDDLRDRVGPKHTFSVECPYGTEDQRVLGYALAKYPLSRNRMPDPFVEDLDRDSEKDPGASTREYVRWQRGARSNTLVKRMEDWLDTASAHDNVWLVLVFHGVDGVGWEPKSKEELEEYFRYIKSKESKVWVATFQDVAKYMRERMHTRIAAEPKEGAIQITLSGDLDPGLYDLPLTLKTRIPDTWKSAKIEQRGKSTTVPSGRDAAGPYVTYRAYPSGGPIVLRSGG
jgi:peptidoglycan/xylan/chitin deacetylase (PgdA/CDA1 family)